MALATFEKTVLALEPIKRIVPTTMTRITASMTAYSAMSWPLSSHSNLRACSINIFVSPHQLVDDTRTVSGEPGLGQLPFRDSRHHSTGNHNLHPATK